MYARHLTLLASLLFAVLFAGCVPSEHPLYTEDDLVFDEALIGDWQCESKVTGSIQKLNDKTYKWINKQSDGRVFMLRLLRLRDHYFIDTTDVDGLHWFGKVAVQGNSLTFIPLNKDRLREILKTHPDAIKHKSDVQFSTECIRLTATTKDLQAFVLAHINDTNLFEPTSVNTRLKKLDVNESGLASKAQRTFDYWWLWRASIMRTALPAKSAKTANLEFPTSGIVARYTAESVSCLTDTLGVDEDAVNCVLEATKTFKRLDAFVKRNGSNYRVLDALRASLMSDAFGVPKELLDADKELGAQLQQTSERVKKTRTQLTARYNKEFPAVGGFVGVTTPQNLPSTQAQTPEKNVTEKTDQATVCIKVPDGARVFVLENGKPKDEMAVQAV